MKSHHIPILAHHAFLLIRPELASIKDVPFDQLPAFKQRQIIDYVDTFAERLCKGIAAQELWAHWNQHFAENNAGNFVWAIWISYGSLKEIRDRIAAAKKDKTKESMANHCAKLIRLIEQSECIKGLNDYVQSSAIQKSLAEFQQFLQSANYGLDETLTDSQTWALDTQKSVPHVDFKRQLANQLMSGMGLKNTAILRELILLAIACLYPELEGYTKEDVARGLHKASSVSRKKSPKRVVKS